MNALLQAVSDLARTQARCKEEPCSACDYNAQLIINVIKAARDEPNEELNLADVRRLQRTRF